MFLKHAFIQVATPHFPLKNSGVHALFAYTWIRHCPQYQCFTKLYANHYPMAGTQRSGTQISVKEDYQ